MGQKFYVRYIIQFRILVHDAFLWNAVEKIDVKISILSINLAPLVVL